MINDNPEQWQQDYTSLVAACLGPTHYVLKVGPATAAQGGTATPASYHPSGAPHNAQQAGPQHAGAYQNQQAIPRPRQQRAATLLATLGKGPWAGPHVLRKWLATRPGALYRLGKEDEYGQPTT